jgi:type IV fimbrial biogenesis protein FimT
VLDREEKHVLGGGNLMKQRGFSLVELMIGLVVFAILMAIAVPSFSRWIANSQIRTAADTMMAGITLARSEALRRNATVRFQLTSTLTSACVLSTTGTNWIVSLSDPTSLCNVDPSTSTAPLTIQKKPGTEGAPNAAIATTGGTTIYFNGFGRLTTPAGITGITQIDISNPTGGACEHVTAGSPMRCLRIRVSSSGNTKLCDPAVSSTGDPRYCN